MKVLMVCRKRVKNDWLSVISDITFLIKVWNYILQIKIFFTRNINDYKKKNVDAFKNLLFICWFFKISYKLRFNKYANHS